MMVSFCFFLMLKVLDLICNVCVNVEVIIWLRFVICLIEFGGSLDLAAIVDFEDSSHDVIVDADENPFDLSGNIAAECGVYFDKVSALIFQIC